jgi:hypothetical protein
MFVTGIRGCHILVLVTGASLVPWHSIGAQDNIIIADEDFSVAGSKNERLSKDNYPANNYQLATKHGTYGGSSISVPFRKFQFFLAQKLANPPDAREGFEVRSLFSRDRSLFVTADKAP